MKTKTVGRKSCPQGLGLLWLFFQQLRQKSCLYQVWPHERAGWRIFSHFAPTQSSHCEARYTKLCLGSLVSQAIGFVLAVKWFSPAASLVAVVEPESPPLPAMELLLMTALLSATLRSPPTARTQATRLPMEALIFLLVALSLDLVCIRLLLFWVLLHKLH